MTFTVEEISLLLEVDHSTKKAAMQALIALSKITESADEDAVSTDRQR